MPLNPPISLLFEDFKVGCLSVVELLIIIPSIPKARLIKAISLACSSSISGDILISIQRVKENANIFQVTFLNELQRVMVHGLLHLLGYKDRSKKEKKIMQKKEDYYISKIV